MWAVTRRSPLDGVGRWPVRTAAVGVTSPSAPLAATGPIETPLPLASVTKLLWSEYHKRLGEIAVGILGADAMTAAGPPGDEYKLPRWQSTFVSSRAGTIFSGTSQIQRNIIGERALGLPKEPSAEANE